MKYLSVFLILLIEVSLCLNASDKLSSNAKKSQINNYPYNDQENMLSFDENLQTPHSQKAEFHHLVNFYQKPSKKEVKNKKKKLRFRKRKTFKDPLSIIKQGWLKISSQHFLNTGRFPMITLPNAKQVRIRVNKSYFRINDTFNRKKRGNQFPPKKLYFWFRLSGKHLYYNQLPSELNILGNVRIKNVKNSKISAEPECFQIVDIEKRNWKLCAENETIRNKWVCVIKDILGYPNDESCKSTSLLNSSPTVITKKVTQPIILIPVPSKICNENWDYSRKGQDWICDCADGKEQSPINLPPPDKAISSPIKPIFRFEEVEVSKEETTDDGQHKDTETVKIEFRDGALRIKHKILGKAVTLDGALYEADEIIFHSPSEHQINGRTYDMEMQVIFHGMTKGDIAKHLVLSFVFEKAPGVYNKFIDDLDFFSLPNPIQRSRKLVSNIMIPRIFYTAGEESADIMKPFSFYTYHGSLSHPPCTERTINYVASQPIKLGSTALQLFKEAIRTPDKLLSTGDVIISNIPPENNRLIQSLNGRSIFYYDHVRFCGGFDPSNKKIKQKGHYEKLNKKIIDYYYVNGENPSGLPGAFVVSEKEAVGKEDN